MIEKLYRERLNEELDAKDGDIVADAFSLLAELWMKQCEIIDHLNTQEEKAKQLGVAEPCIVPTASNQSNTELPKKIKLLREFAGYPAGEYKNTLPDEAIERGYYNYVYMGDEYSRE